MSLLQIYQWVCQWKNFENRLTFGEVMGKSLVSCFFSETQCILTTLLSGTVSDSVQDCLWPTEVFQFHLWMCFLQFSWILCFCILFYIVGSCKCRISGLVVQLLFWANKWWWWWWWWFEVTSYTIMHEIQALLTGENHSQMCTIK